LLESMSVGTLRSRGYGNIYGLTPW
jgi:hypothetical protein